jgi:adenylate cyclase
MRWLFVVARNSSFTYKGRAVDVKQVGRELGVRYLLEGSVRKARSRVRITGQLIDAATGTHLWADHFEGSLGDVFDLQDQVAASVVGAIGPQLERAEVERRSANQPRSGCLRLLSARVGKRSPVNESNDDALRQFSAMSMIRIRWPTAWRVVLRDAQGERLDAGPREIAQTERLALKPWTP